MQLKLTQMVLTGQIFSAIPNPLNKTFPGGASHWDMRACGVTSVYNLLVHYGCLSDESIPSLILEGLARDGYCPAGWKHQALANMLKQRGVEAEPQMIGAELSAIENLINSGYLMIASVGLNYPQNGTKGGHLVVFCGYGGNSIIKHVAVRDPAPSQIARRWVNWRTLERSFSGRIIRCRRPPNGHAAKAVSRLAK